MSRSASNQKNSYSSLPKTRVFTDTTSGYSRPPAYAYEHTHLNEGEPANTISWGESVWRAVRALITGLAIFAAILFVLAGAGFLLLCWLLRDFHYC